MMAQAGQGSRIEAGGNPLSDPIKDLSEARLASVIESAAVLISFLIKLACAQAGYCLSLERPTFNESSVRYLIKSGLASPPVPERRGQNHSAAHRR